MKTKWLRKGLMFVLLAIFIDVGVADDFNSNTDLVVVKFGDIDSKNVEKILSAGKVADLILPALAPNEMLGFSYFFDDSSKAFLPPITRNLPTLGGIYGKGMMISMEKIVSLKPDLMLDVGSVNQNYIDSVKRVYEKTNIPVILIDGNFADSAKQIRTIAKYINKTQRGEILANYTQRVLDVTKNSTIKGDKFYTIYFARSADGLEAAVADSIHDEVLKWIGLKNIVDAKNQKGLARVSLEQLYKWQPDIIITQDLNTYNHILNSPNWKELKAIQNKNVYLAPNKPFGWLGQPPSINRILGALYLTHKLAPHKLNASDYKQFIREYFKLFYDYKLTLDDEKLFDIN
ncbi:ABC transporter substrate-binding protein [Campylobacter sp.]|uniref:ABC transporter substrate-binding protein n=1 Tax=Campylobacter sp. TaxID=205 RepID=UPI0025BDFA21|nr:ABC transporter substrate-binding protein [Campylobacter sp.]